MPARPRRTAPATVVQWIEFPSVTTTTTTTTSIHPSLGFGGCLWLSSLSPSSPLSLPPSLPRACRASTIHTPRRLRPTRRRYTHTAAATAASSSPLERNTHSTVVPVSHNDRPTWAHTGPAPNTLPTGWRSARGALEPGAEPPESCRPLLSSGHHPRQRNSLLFPSITCSS
jgi:hypothetical protein